MLLKTRKKKPIGIGSLLNMSSDSIKNYNLKKSGAYNDRISNSTFILLGFVNSCDQKIARVLQVYVSTNTAYNNSVFLSRNKDNIKFISLSSVVESKTKYSEIFHDKEQIFSYLLNNYGIVASGQ